MNNFMKKTYVAQIGMDRCLYLDRDLTELRRYPFGSISSLIVHAENKIRFTNKQKKKKKIEIKLFSLLSLLCLLSLLSLLSPLPFPGTVNSTTPRVGGEGIEVVADATPLPSPPLPSPLPSPSSLPSLPSPPLLYFFLEQ